MTRPLRSTPITGTSSLLRAGPPARPATVLTPDTNARLLPLANESDTHSTEFDGQCRDALSHVPCKSRRPGSCRLNAGHHLARKPGHPPGPAPAAHHMAAVSVPLLTLTTHQQRGYSSSWSPPDTSQVPFPHRSPRRSSANAACGGLKPPPDRRLRRAKPSSLAKHRFS
jgi:hypothetical protein